MEYTVYTLKDHSGTRDDITINISPSDSVMILRRHLMVKLMTSDDEPPLITEESICMWTSVGGSDKIRLLTEYLEDSVTTNSLAPIRAPSNNSQPLEIINKVDINRGDLDMTTDQRTIWYLTLYDFVKMYNFSTQPPALSDSNMNLSTYADTELFAIDEYGDFVMITVGYWPITATEQDGIELTMIILDAFGMAEQHDSIERKKMEVRITVDNYREQLAIESPDKKIRELATALGNRRGDISLTYALLEVQPKVNVSGTNFVNLLQLFYYFRLDTDVPFKMVRIAGDSRQPKAIYSKLSDEEKQQVQPKKAKLTKPQFLVRVRATNKSNYVTMRFMADGRITISNSWSASDQDTMASKLQETLTMAETVIERVNSVTGKRPVFVTANGLPSVVKRYRTRLNIHDDSTVRLLLSDGVFDLPVKMVKSKLLNIMRSRLFSNYIERSTASSGSRSDKLMFDYIRNNTTAVKLLIDPGSRVTIRHAKGKKELETIELFLNALVKKYANTNKLKIVDFETTLKHADKTGQSIYELWRDKEPRIPKLAILKHYKAVPKRGSYSTECQQDRQPIIITDEEKQRYQNEFTYVMNYKNHNFVCDRNSEHMFPGLSRHDQRLIPCCFSRDQRKMDVYKKEVEQEIDDESKTIISIRDYWLTDQNKIIEPGRIGELHGFKRKTLLYQLFNMRVGHHPVNKNQRFVRIGVNQDGSGFIRSILALIDTEYFEVRDIVKNQKVEGFKQELGQEVTGNEALFLSLNRGQIKDKYNDASTFASEIDSMVHHEELLDLVHKVKEVNIFVFEIPDKGPLNNISILCHQSEDTFDERFHSLFIIKRENTYEPIMLVSRSDNAVLERTFPYFSDDNTAIANVVYDLWRSSCIVAAATRGKPRTAHETKRILDATNITVVGQSIRTDRCEGLLVKLNNNRAQIMVPVIPSDPIYQGVPIVTGYRPLTLGHTKQRLDWLASNTPMHELRPKSQIINDETDQIVAIMLENNLLVAVQPTPRNRKLQSLVIDETARYYPDIDEYIKTGEQLPDRRTVMAEKLQRHNDFWYNLRVYIALYFLNRPSVQQEFIDILDDDTLSYEDRKKQIHPKFAPILAHIFNSRQLRRLFPVNILGIRGKGYRIAAAGDRDKYVPCDRYQTEHTCSDAHHCQWSNGRCEPTPEQAILTSYYFTLLHEIITDSEHHLIRGQLGDMMSMIEKVQHPDEVHQ